MDPTVSALLFAALGYCLWPAPVLAYYEWKDWQRTRKYELKLTYDPATGFVDLMKYAYS